jgi:MFS family permease
LHGLEASSDRPARISDSGPPAASTVLALFAGIVSAAVIYDALPPILPILAASFGGGQYGALIAQLTTTTPILGMAFSGPFSGIAIERFGIRAVLLIAIMTFALAGSVGMVVVAAVPLLASRLVTGLAAGTLMTCGSSIIAMSFNGIEQTRMMGRVFAVGAICSISFVFISGAVAVISWRAPFLLHAAVALLFFIPVMRMPRQTVSPPAAREKGGSFGILMRFKPAVPAYLAIAALVLLASLFTVQIAFLTAESAGASPQLIANICMGHALMSFVGNVSLARVSTRIGVIPTLRLAFCLLAAGAFVCAGSSVVWTIALGAAIGGLGVGFGIPLAINLIMRRVPVALAPRALGLGTTMMYVGGACGPLIIVPLSNALTLRGVYYCAGASIITGIVFMLLAGLFGDRRGQALP